jgi:hypothetical protein
MILLLNNPGFKKILARKKTIKGFLTASMNLKCCSLKLKKPMKSSIFRFVLSFRIMKLWIFYGLAVFARFFQKKNASIKKNKS